MKKSSKSKSVLRKRSLQFESLENRQMLSAAPMAADVLESSTAFYVEPAAVEQGNAGAQAFAESLADVSATAASGFDVAISAGNKVTITFNAEAGTTYKITVDREPFNGGKTVETVKTVTVRKDGIYTYSFSGKENSSYLVTVKAGAMQLGKAEFEISAAPKLKKVEVRDDSVTFDVTNANLIAWTASSFTLNYSYTNAAKQVITDSATITYSNGQWHSTNSNVSISITPDAGRVTVTGLLSNTVYTFSAMRNSDMKVDGAKTNDVSSKAGTLKLKTTLTEYEQVVVAGVTLTDRTDVGVTVTWTPVQGKDAVGNAGYASSYVFTFTTTDAKGRASTKTVAVDVRNAVKNVDGTLSTVIKSLSPEKTYTVSVKAKGDKYFSTGVEAFVGTMTTKARLANASLKKETSTDDTVVITAKNWTQIQSKGATELRVTINGKEVLLTQSGNWENGNMAFDPDTGRLTITSLAANANYTITMRFSGAEAVSQKTSSIKVKTALTAYNQVAGVEVTDRTTDSLTVAWSAVGGKDGNSIATAYVITVMDVATGKVAKTLTVKATSGTVKGLSANKEYSVTVRATADRNYSAGQNSVAVSTKTAVKLSTPKITVNESGEMYINCNYDLPSLNNLKIGYTISGSGSLTFSGSARSDSVSYSGVLSEVNSVGYLYTQVSTDTKNYGMEVFYDINFNPVTGRLILDIGFEDDGVTSGKVSGTLTITSISGTDHNGSPVLWSGTATSPRISMTWP